MKVSLIRAMLFTLLLVLPAIVQCRISINVQVDNDPNKVSAKVSGRITEIIPDAERAEWRLNDPQLMDAAQRYSGGRPTNVYVKSPTPWNDLYRTYGWSQVQRTLDPINATIVGVTSQPFFMISKIYRNNHEKNTFTFDVSRRVEERISTMWSVQKELTVGQSIDYSFSFLGSGIGGQTSIAYAAQWGHSEYKETSFSFGTAVGIEMELKEGQAVKCSLYATRGVMEIRVFYRATVGGRVACNYPKRYNGHHFWAYDVNACLMALGAQTVMEFSELIRIEHYSQGRLVLEELDPTNLQVEELDPTAPQVEPFETYQVDAESVKPGQVNAESVKPEQVDAESVKPGQVDAESIKPEKVDAESVKPERVDAESVKPDQVNAESVKPEQVDAKPEQVDAESVKPKQVDAEAVTSV